jgi:transcriptional regulator
MARIIQFVYWNLRRHGLSQAEIARRFKISRQAVNKSIMLQEREVLFRLLECAQTSGVLVEWQDAVAGVLIGITPQLGNLPCIMVVDRNKRILMFYDQARNQDKAVRAKVTAGLRNTLEETLRLSIDNDASFKDVIEAIIRSRKEESP